MCCLFSALVVFGPRAGCFIWWLMDPVRWNLAFGSFIWPILGFLILPWTTLMYVAVAPGGIDGLDWLLVGLGVVLDVATYGGSGYGNRKRVRGYGGA